jgi:stress response protein SCP2
MAISLQKGQKISLSKDNTGNATGLRHAVVGLGWDERKPASRGLFGFGGMGQAEDIDCDAFALMLKSGRLESSNDIVYYGNLHHRSGAVNHTGDNLTGAGAGDDESISIDLDRVPVDYDRIVIGVNIYRAEAKKQDFGLIDNAFMRVYNGKTGVEMARFNLSEKYAGKTSIIFGELYRHNGEWKFNAVGSGFQGGLAALCANYGINVG